MKFLAMGCIGLAVTGCNASQTPPSQSAAAVSDSTMDDATWVSSDDGVLALRLSVKSPQAANKESFHVAAAIRNSSGQKVTVLRPFGDWYAARAVGMKIWNADQQIRYTGPHATYVIGADAFAVLAPGETLEDQLELTIDNFAGLKPEGPYMLRYDYSYKGQWDATAAAGGSGVKDAWRGTICSREVAVVLK